jgi:SpoVK/Ycf46/Vps4 family AAA+-type ATPase
MSVFNDPFLPTTNNKYLVRRSKPSSSSTKTISSYALDKRFSLQSIAHKSELAKLKKKRDLEYQRLSKDLQKLKEEKSAQNGQSDQASINLIQKHALELDVLKQTIQELNEQKDAVHNDNGITPNDTRILIAAVDALMKIDLYTAGGLLRLLYNKHCINGYEEDALAERKREEDLGQGQFVCLTDNKGTSNINPPELANVYDNIMVIFFELGGTRYHLDGIEGSSTSTAASSGSGGGGSSSSGEGSSGNSNSNDEEKQSETQKKECELRDAIKPIDSNVVWGGSDFSGAKAEKEAIMTGFILPMKFPKLFKPEKAMLLYGTPGGGKTMIAKALMSLVRNEFTAHEDKMSLVLYGATPSDFLSTFQGGTEEKINRYYDVLQKRAEGTSKCNDKYNAANPGIAKSFLFIDELEGLASSRQDDKGGKMASTVPSLLQAIEGVKDTSKVVTIGATNLPWLLDSAILRRFTVKIHVDLPGFQARQSMISTNLINRIFGNKNPTPAEINNLNTEILPLIYQLVRATGWTEDGVGTLLAGMGNYESRRSDETEEVFLKRLEDTITEKKILPGDHINYKSDETYELATSPDNNRPDSNDDEDDNEENKEEDTKWLTKKSERVISTPRHIFGFTASDIISMIKTAFNTFSRYLLVRLQHKDGALTYINDYEARNLLCYVYDEPKWNSLLSATKTPKCDQIPPEKTPSISLDIFRKYRKIFHTIINNLLDNTKSSVVTKDYLQLTAYQLFDKYEIIDNTTKVEEEKEES